MLLFEDESDGPVVDKAYFHVCSKRSRGDCRADFSEFGDEKIVEALSLFGASGIDPGRATAFAAVTIKRELRDCQYPAADIFKAPVHLAIVIGKYPEINTLSREAYSHFFCVVVMDADKEHNAPVDGANSAPVDGNRGLRYALEDDFHGMLSVVVGMENTMREGE